VAFARHAEKFYTLSYRNSRGNGFLFAHTSFIVVPILTSDFRGDFSWLFPRPSKYYSSFIFISAAWTGSSFPGSTCFSDLPAYYGRQARATIGAFADQTYAVGT
jgi:hypothetical protein